MLCHIELKFRIWLCFTVLQINSSVVNFRQSLKEVCPFWNVEYWKYTVFRTFRLHAFTYWAENLHFTLFYCTTDQVRVSSICVNFFKELCPFWNLEYLKYTVFHTFLLHALTYRAEIVLQIKFECCQFPSIFDGVIPLWNLEYSQFSALLSYTHWHIKLKYCIWLCFTVLQIRFECP